MYLRAAKREQAATHLDTAVAMYRDMDMRGWLAHAVEKAGRLS